MAVGAVAAAGASYAGASAQADAAGQASAAMQGLGRWIPHITPASFTQLNLSNPWSQLNSYDKYATAYAPKAEAAAGVINQSYQNTLNSSAPGLSDSLANQSRYVNELSDGRISSDSAGAVSRSSAFKALQGGFGLGSDGGNAISARDLGLSVESQKARGAAMLPGVAQLAQAMSPTSAASLMPTAQQLLARTDQQTTANWQSANQEIAYNKSIETENANALYQGHATMLGAQAQGIMAQGAAQAQQYQAMGQAVGGMAGAYGQYQQGYSGGSAGQNPFGGGGGYGGPSYGSYAAAQGSGMSYGGYNTGNFAPTQYPSSKYGY